MTAIINRSTHLVSLIDGEIVEESDLGSIRRVTADNFPIRDRGPVSMWEDEMRRP
jgi:oxalate decarboxylase